VNDAVAWRRVRGFSLVELMVALTAGLLVAGVIATMFASNARTYAVTNGIGELQEAGRVAFDVLQRDLRMAGYQGCDSRADTPAPRLVNLDADAGAEGSVPAAIMAHSDAAGDTLVLQVPAGEASALMRRRVARRWATAS
jgi:prepilin-type N-terminal cleavage/methylation domain-containing protein